MAILTDAEKRKSYDLYGAEDEQNVNRRQRSQYHTYGYSRGFESDVTAEELFNMFFGGSAFQQQNVYRSSRRFRRDSPTEENQVCLLHSNSRCEFLIDLYFVLSLFSNNQDTRLLLICYQYYC